MPRTLTAAALVSVHGELTDEVWLAFVEVSHPLLPEIRRYVSGVETEVAPAGGVWSVSSTTATTVPSSTTLFASADGTVWEPAPFSVTIPADGLERLPTVTLRVPTIDMALVTALRGLIEPPDVSVHFALASSPHAIELGPYDMQAAGATPEPGGVAMVIRLTYEDILNRPVVPPRYTPGLTPGLHK